MDWTSAKIVVCESDRNEYAFGFSNFVETGSRSRKIICSVLNSSDSSLMNVSARHYQNDGDRHGILVTAIYNSSIRGVKLTVLLMQEGADEGGFKSPVSVEYYS
jgi:hypothetical protein